MSQSPGVHDSDLIAAIPNGNRVTFQEQVKSEDTLIRSPDPYLCDLKGFTSARLEPLFQPYIECLRFSQALLLGHRCPNLFSMCHERSRFESYHALSSQANNEQ